MWIQPRRSRCSSVGFILTLGLLLVAGAPGREKFVQVFGDEFDIGVGTYKEMEVDPKYHAQVAPACESFALTSDQVRFFFRHSDVVDGPTYAKEYADYPCWIEGEGRFKGQDFDWSVTPAGKGSLRSKDGELTYVVCDADCAELFPNGGNMFAEDG